MKYLSLKEAQMTVKLRTQRSPFGGFQRGFTLLELMISIALISIIVVIIFGAMRLGFRSVDAGEKKVESLERVRASLNIIDSQIQSGIPLTYNKDGTKKNYFIGEKEYLQLSTNYSIWGGQRGYVVVAYRIEPDSHGKQALYASENTIGIENGKETKLLDSLDKLYFEYFYKGPTDEKGNWIEQWTDESNIPEKIRLHLIDGENEISMIIPIRANNLQTSSSGALVFGPNVGQ